MTDKIDELINRIEEDVSEDVVLMEEKETWFSKWKKKRAQEKEFKRGIMEEARQEALKDLKPELVAHIKQKELDRLSGKNNFMAKVGKQMEKMGENIAKKDFGKMMSSGSRAGPGMSMGNTGFMSQDKVNQLLGKKPQPKPRAKRKTVKKKR